MHHQFVVRSECPPRHWQTDSAEMQLRRADKEGKLTFVAHEVRTHNVEYEVVENNWVALSWTQMVRKIRLCRNRTQCGKSTQKQWTKLRAYVAHKFFTLFLQEVRAEALGTVRYPPSKANTFAIESTGSLYVRTRYLEITSFWYQCKRQKSVETSRHVIT
jgi:hypothetical protein